MADTFAQLGESLQKLHPASEPLAQALDNAVEASLRSGQPPPTELAMEVATSVLYLGGGFEDLDPHDRQLTARTVQLAGRIDRVREGGRSEPLEPWMEELYRRVSDRQTMGTVVDELRAHLGELEKSLDQFFRRPAEKRLAARRAGPAAADARRVLGAGPRPGRAGRAAHAREGRAAACGDDADRQPPATSTRSATTWARWAS